MVRHGAHSRPWHKNLFLWWRWTHVFFTELGWYPFAIRQEIARWAGYAGSYLTLWESGYKPDWRAQSLRDLPALRKLRGGIVYAALELDKPFDRGDNGQFLELLRKGHLPREIELSVQGGRYRCSDAAKDKKFIQWFELARPWLEKYRITLSLYPHQNFWVERVEDAVRLCKKIHHPRLKAVFNLFHWFIVDGADLNGKIQLAKPWLGGVQVTGLGRVGHVNPIYSFQALDEGILDLFTVLCLLKQHAYRGRITVQGFGMGGDVAGKLQRSARFFRMLEKRWPRRSHWHSNGAK
ncbi:TIM barrel protein [Kamptonema cortianum]|nr:TIM barrel protein [Kamptonema cortianum]